MWASPCGDLDIPVERVYIIAGARLAGLVDWFNASFSQFERTYRTE
jgi:hypothetical protein